MKQPFVGCGEDTVKEAAAETPAEKAARKAQNKQTLSHAWKTFKATVNSTKGGNALAMGAAGGVALGGTVAGIIGYKAGKKKDKTLKTNMEKGAMDTTRKESILALTKIASKRVSAKAVAGGALAIPFIGATYALGMGHGAIAGGGAGLAVGAGTAIPITASIAKRNVLKNLSTTKSEYREAKASKKAEKKLKTYEMAKAAACGPCGGISSFGQERKRKIQEQLDRYNRDARVKGTNKRARQREYVEVYEEPPLPKLRKPGAKYKPIKYKEPKVVQRYRVSENYDSKGNPALDKPLLKFEKVARSAEKWRGTEVADLSDREKRKLLSKRSMKKHTKRQKSLRGRKEDSLGQHARAARANYWLGPLGGMASTTKSMKNREKDRLIKALLAEKQK